MVIIERSRDFLYVCDYKGYAKGKIYHITKVKKEYVANQAYAKVQVTARTLKELAVKLDEVTA